jgi:hypothetical protein
MTALSREGRQHWLAALLMGLVFILALLIASWFLRACAPVEPTANVSTLETPAPPAPPPPPDPTPALKASLDEVEGDGRKLHAELAALETEIKAKLAQCKPVEPPKPVPPPKPVEPPKPPVAAAPPPLPADRWEKRDLGMLQGCWRLGRDTEANIALGNRTERCAVRAGRICFGNNGGGERQTTASCPSTGVVSCSAPITARFGNDNTLGTTQPQVPCRPSSASWNGPPNSLTCRRVSDTLALCRDKLNFEYEFRRE